MINKFWIAVIILLLVGLISIPFQMINASHADKYKVQVKLKDGTQFTAYTTKSDYDDYLGQKDLKLTGRTIKYETINYVIQVYNPHGSKTVNQPIH